MSATNDSRMKQSESATPIEPITGALRGRLTDWRSRATERAFTVLPMWRRAC